MTISHPLHSCYAAHCSLCACLLIAMQEQLRHDVAVLNKQLATQIDSLERESKAKDHLQEQHERQMRHFKLEVKRRLVSRGSICSLSRLSKPCL